MEPSNRDVVRFVASYGGGFHLPFRRLILGFGYGDLGGISHSGISRIYFGEKIIENAREKLYAGYLYVEESKVKVFEYGGSQTLRINGSPEKNEKFIMEINRSEQMKSAILHIFPLLVSEKIGHVMLANQ